MQAICQSPDKCRRARRCCFEPLVFAEIILFKLCRHSPGLPISQACRPGLAGPKRWPPAALVCARPASRPTLAHHRPIDIQARLLSTLLLLVSINKNNQINLADEQKRIAFWRVVILFVSALVSPMVDHRRLAKRNGRAGGGRPRIPIVSESARCPCASLPVRQSASPPGQHTHTKVHREQPN